MSVVVSLCDRTGNAVRPWAAAGYECWCVDVQHSIRKPRFEEVGSGIIHYTWGDVRSWKPPRRPSFLMAWPPCTDVTVSDARDFQDKGPVLLADAMYLFGIVEMVACYAGCPYFIENPVGVLSSHIRKPDYIFQPWQYGDNWSKATCLWTGGGFRMPPPTVYEKPKGDLQRIWKMPPGDERANLRSETPTGFALAVFESNARRMEVVA
jgi:hypothetical protein